jgi:hypothetical protein
MIRAGIGIVNKYGVAYDSDAQAFITACANAGVTLSSTIQDAINNFVLGLKADSLWTKCYAIYPFVGGAAASHKFNLKDPQDADAAFRLTFAGSPTHDSNGVTFASASSQIANAYWNPTTYGLQNSIGTSVYSKTNNEETTCLMGCSSTNVIVLRPRRATNTMAVGICTSGVGATATNNDSSGFFTAVRVASNSLKVYRNGTEILSSTVSSAGLPNFNMGIGGRNASTPSEYCNKNIAMAIIHEGLNATEAGNLNSRHSTFQTALGR